MKVEDLMVGDWVFIKDYPMSAQPMQVKKEHFVRSLVEFEPIPLTPEILEKNGFELIKGIYPTLRNHYKDIIFQMVEIEETKHNKPFYTFKGYPIFYIHQLQHALKLCGIDKELII